MVQGHDFRLRLLAQEGDRILIPKVITRSYGVMRVLFPGVSTPESSVDAGTRAGGVATHRVKLRHDRYIHLCLPGRQRCPHARDPTADYHDVMYRHDLSPY
jgi:hypothetical protein